MGCTRLYNWVAWLLVGVMLFAGGAGHLLHTCLHEHCSNSEHHRSVAQLVPVLNADHLGDSLLQASFCGSEHHRSVGLRSPVLTSHAHDKQRANCPFCAFLSHFVAQEAEPADCPGIEPSPGMGIHALRSFLLASNGHALPDSRSPPPAQGILG